MINVELLRKTLEHITAHPEEWNQDTWGMRVFSKNNVCQTSYCLAGHAVVLAGHEFRWPISFDVVIHTSFTEDAVHIRDAARDALGLTEKQAYMLFEGTNSLYRLWVFANRWTDGEIEIPEGVYST